MISSNMISQPLKIHYFKSIATLFIIILVLIITKSSASEASLEDNISYWYPTDEEFELAYAYRAPKWWGARVRKNKILRIAFIGGSQTANYRRIYPTLLEKMIKKHLGTTWEVKMYNEGASGMGPSIRLLHFELLPVSEWPNIISLDHGINCGIGDIPCAKEIDAEISSIKDRYIRKNLDPPYFMFIEYFRPSTAYGSHFPKRDSNLTVIKSNPNITVMTPPDFFVNEASSRGSAPGVYMLELARFHQMPFISVKDAFYPSLTRFVATHPITNRYPLARKYRLLWCYFFFV